MKSGPPSERLVRNVSVALLLALIGYILADLSVLSQRDKWFPSQPPPAKSSFVRPVAQTDRSVYNIITSNNIFRADQTDPNPSGTGSDPKSAAPDADPAYAHPLTPRQTHAGESVSFLDADQGTSGFSE